MKVLSDEQLLKIVTVDSGDYRPEAIEAAREVLRWRNINEQTSETYETIRRAAEKEAEPPMITGRRFTNFIVDLILFRFGSALAVAILFGFPAWTFELELMSLPVMFLLYFTFESTIQRTPGKFLTGTRVVADDGSHPTVGAIAIRTISRFVPFEPLSGGSGRWWHDRWSRTRVVRKPRLTGTIPNSVRSHNRV